MMDWSMMRWAATIGLALLLMATAIGVIYTRNEARKSFVELQQLETERDELNVDWGRLQLEHATAAEAGRVEQVARGQLGLVQKPPQRVVVVVAPDNNDKKTAQADPPQVRSP